jgi:hypothetical protein
VLAATLVGALLSPDRAWLEAWCVLAGLLSTATRKHRPPTAGDALLTLHACEPSLQRMARLAQGKTDIVLTVRRTAPAAVACDPELSVRSEHVPEGLVSLALRIASAGPGRATLVWNAHAIAGSEAAELLSRAFPYARATHEGAWTVPSAKPAEELAQLLEWLESVSPRDELGRPAPARAA